MTVPGRRTAAWMSFLTVLALAHPASAQSANPWMGAPASTKPAAEAEASRAAARQVPMPIPRPSSIGEPQAGPAPAAPLSASPGVPRPAPVPGTPVAADNSPRAIVERANATLNGLVTLSAEFTQTSANGRRQTGSLYVQKPGRMRFEYDPPSPVEIVADGSSVAIRDRKLNTQDIYAIGQTPLKFLLKDRVDLGRDTKILDVRHEPDMSSITLEDKSTFGGTSRVTLFFDNRNFALKQWVVVDPQGYETAVALRNLNTSARLDSKLFDINYMRLLQ